MPGFAQCRSVRACVVLLAFAVAVVFGGLWLAQDAEAAAFGRGFGGGGFAMRRSAPVTMMRRPMMRSMTAKNLRLARTTRLSRNAMMSRRLTDRRLTVSAGKSRVLTNSKIASRRPSTEGNPPNDPGKGTGGGKYPPGRGEGNNPNPGKDGGHRRPPVVVIPPLGPIGPSGPVAYPAPPPPARVITNGPSGPTGNRPSGSGGAPPAGPGPFAPAVTDSRYVPNEVLVSFPATMASQAIVGFAQEQRLALLAIHQLPLINTALYRFRITDGRQVPAVVQSLGTDARVGAVQPNYLYFLQGETQGIGNGVAAQYALEKIRVREAHAVATGSNVLIAVIDTGIDATHPELQDKVAGTMAATRGANPTDGHGTAMASAMVAHASLLGIAPAARLLSVPAFDGATGPSQSTTARVLEGLQWAADSGARVVNMSFTGPADPRLHQMIAAARARGLVLIAAAGNEGPKAPAAFPAAYPEVIAVTATDQEDRIFVRANRGSYVALAAPGVDVFVAMPNAGYTLTTGTSVAAAHVSGIAALLVERNPQLTPDAVQAILMSSAKDLGPAGRDELFGSGLADAVAALRLMAPRLADQAEGNTGR